MMNGAEVANDVAQAAQTEEELPLFEIIVPSLIVGATEPVVHLKIWADGRVHGLLAITQPGQGSAIILNRVPNMLGNLMSPLQDYLDQVEGLRRATEATAAKPGQG